MKFNTDDLYVSLEIHVRKSKITKGKFYRSYRSDNKEIERKFEGELDGWNMEPNNRRAHYKAGLLHNENGPAVIADYISMQIIGYYLCGDYHRLDGPAYASPHVKNYFFYGKLLSKIKHIKVVERMNECLKNLELIGEQSDEALCRQPEDEILFKYRHEIRL